MTNQTEATHSKNRMAVVLAGGMGKRMLPLTAFTPKPMLEVMGEPIIKKLLRWLRKNGIYDAALAVGHQKEIIMSALGEGFEGTKLQYLIEDRPLGSAYAVKRARDCLTPYFAVICGDAYCDFDLSYAFDLMELSGADALILTSSSSNPQKYGSVITDKDGSIIGFSEKPPLSGIFTKTVNTGIYILKRSVLDIIPEKEYDFGKDLFPEMLARGMSLKAYEADGLWLDIGDPDSYLECNLTLSGGENVISDISFVAETDKIERSLVLSGVMIGDNCNIYRAIIGQGCVIGKNVTVKEGAVIGPDSVIGDGCIIAEGAVINEKTALPEGSIILNPLYKKELFYGRDIILSGDSRAIGALGTVIRRAIGYEKIIGVISSGSSYAVKYGDILAKSLSVTQVQCSDHPNTLYLENGFSAEAIEFAGHYNTDLTLFLSVSDDNCIKITPLTREGGYISSETEQKILSAARLYHDGEKPLYSLPITVISDFGKIYSEILKKRYIPDMKNKSDIKLTVSTDERVYSRIKDIFEADFIKTAIESKEKPMNISSIGHDEIFACIPPDGMSCTVYHGGVTLDADMLTALSLLNKKRLGVTKISLPYRTPLSVLQLARENGMSVMRHSLTKSGSEKEKGDGCKACEISSMSGVALLLEYILFITNEKISPSGIRSVLPKFSFIKETCKISSDDIDILISTDKADGEGFLFKTDKGNLRIIPENGQIAEICAESGSIEDARELIKKVTDILNS